LTVAMTFSVPDKTLLIMPFVPKEEAVPKEGNSPFNIPPLGMDNGRPERIIPFPGITPPLGT